MEKYLVHVWPEAIILSRKKTASNIKRLSESKPVKEIHTERDLEDFFEENEDPKPQSSKLEKLFEGYDKSAPYPFEIVDKGGVVGEELI